MTYRRLIIAAALLLTLAPACDSDGDSSTEDAGHDAAGPKSGEKTTEQEQKKSGEPEPDNERPEARADESGTLHEEPPPELQGLVRDETLKELGGGGSYTPTELPGRDPSPSYNSKRYKPEGDGGYGAGLQMWAFEKPKAAGKRLQELRSQYLNTEDIPKAKQKRLGSDSFFSERGGIRNVLFSAENPPRVVAVSCSVEMCEDRSKFLDFAAQVRERATENGESRKTEDSRGDGENSGGDSDEKGDSSGDSK